MYTINITDDRPPKENLRGTVPAGGHVVCVGRSGPDLPRKPKVRDLNEVWAHAEQVLGLHVAVEVAMLVHKGQALQHLYIIINSIQGSVDLSVLCLILKNEISCSRTCHVMKDCI